MLTRSDSAQQGAVAKPHEAALCGATFEYALVHRWGGDGTNETFDVRQATDMVRLRYTVRSDDTWTLEIGEHPTVSASDIDTTLRTVTGDAGTSAATLLRALADHLVFPHSFTLGPSAE